MITEVPDPIGTSKAVKLSGNMSFIYEQQSAFDQGWALTLWFKKSTDPQPDRVITFEDPSDSNNDLRILFEGNNLKIGDATIAWTSTGDWEFLFITSIADSTDILYSLNGNTPQQITPGKTPLNSRVVVGRSAERYFKGELWDIRVYDKRLSTTACNTLYLDVINNSGGSTIPV